MKKAIMIVGVFAFAFALTASVAFASFGDWFGSDDTNVTSRNGATISNDVNTNANTGRNGASRNSGDGTVDTGNALAWPMVRTEANSNETEIGCDCADGDVNVTSTNRAMVRNSVNTNANTGHNGANDNGGIQVKTHGFGFGGWGDRGGDGSVTTGDATAQADVTTVVNSNVTRIR